MYLRVRKRKVKHLKILYSLSINPKPDVMIIHC